MVVMAKIRAGRNILTRGICGCGAAEVTNGQVSSCGLLCIIHLR